MFLLQLQLPRQSLYQLRLGPSRCQRLRLQYRNHRRQDLQVHAEYFLRSSLRRVLLSQLPNAWQRHQLRKLLRQSLGSFVVSLAHIPALDSHLIQQRLSQVYCRQ